MKVTDYIVEFISQRGIRDCFGYPGGVICHFIDSVSKCSDITAHINYNEQGSAFAACGYAQFSGKPGVAYTTSGPGATNLITGIANAYFDSIPCIFLTGQVDTYALADGFPVRQRGFQETNIVSMVKDITKWAVRIDDPRNIKYCLEKAYYIAVSGNPGPVVLDLPADIQRAEIDLDSIESFFAPADAMIDYESIANEILTIISRHKQPVIIAGNGIKQAGEKESFRELAEKLKVPIVSSLPAFDLLPFTHPLNYGFIGTNGHRYANFLLGKADLIISIGSRLDIRQIGLSRDKFAPQAQIVRVDIDKKALAYNVHNNDINYCADLKPLISECLKQSIACEFSEWIGICDQIKRELIGFDDREYNTLISQISDTIPADVNYTIDVGQHQLWFAQSAKIKEHQSVFMSAGHGAMGYSLPAALGIYYASCKPVVVFCGDGGLMMNVQELQFIKREQLPIKIICVNNFSLGMIRGFQERNFNGNYQLTTETSGYLAPNLKKLAKAFGMKYSYVEKIEDTRGINYMDLKPELIELKITNKTTLEPNFGQTGQIQDQLPYMDRELFNKLMSL